LEEDPKNHEALFRLGVLLTREKNYAEARSKFQECLKNNPDKDRDLVYCHICKKNDAF
jgi:Uncharacterized protein conserved in bacteria